MGRITASLVGCAAALVGSTALAQRAAPHVCMPSDPIELAHDAGSSAPSIAIGGPAPSLFVAYEATAAHHAHNVTLLEFAGLRGSDLTVTTPVSVAPGFTSASGLALVGPNLVGAFVRPDHRIGLFSRALGGGALRIGSIDARAASHDVTIATVGERAVVGWSIGGGAIQFTWIDAQGQPDGAVQSVQGTFGAPVAVGAYGGRLVATSGTGPSSAVIMLESSAGHPVTPVIAASNVHEAHDVRANSSGTTLALSFDAHDGAHATLVAAADGTGHDHWLGASDANGETAVTATSWGAFAVWTRSGDLRMVPVASDGTQTTGEFVVAAHRGAERERHVSLASDGQAAIVVWEASRGGSGGRATLRMARVECP